MLMDVVIDCQRQQPKTANNGVENLVRHRPEEIFSPPWTFVFSHSINHLKYSANYLLVDKTKCYRLLMHFLLFKKLRRLQQKTFGAKDPATSNRFQSTFGESLRIQAEAMHAVFTIFLIHHWALPTSHQPWRVLTDLRMASSSALRGSLTWASLAKQSFPSGVSSVIVITLKVSLNLAFSLALVSEVSRVAG